MANSSTRGGKSDAKRPARDRRAIHHPDAVNYRCNTCGKRLATIRPADYAGGWDAIYFGRKVPQADVGRDAWQKMRAFWVDCPRCGAQHRHDDGLELYRKLTRRAGRTVVPLSRRS